MGRPQFNSSLSLPPVRGTPPADEVPGPVARGPVGDDKKLMWIYVWLIQHGEDAEGAWAAAAGQI
jgi:hypothetical protein